MWRLSLTRDWWQEKERSGFLDRLQSNMFYLGFSTLGSWIWNFGFLTIVRFLLGFAEKNTKVGGAGSSLYLFVWFGFADRSGGTALDFSILIFYSFLLIRLCWQEPWWCSTVSTVAVCWMPHCSFSGYYLARVPPGPWQFQLLTAHHGRWAGQIWKQLTLGPRVWGGWQISKLKWKY